jgi:hypothetical protein
MKKLILISCLLCEYVFAFAQSKSDKFLKDLFEKNGSPLLKHILANPDSFHYQFIYTQIDRDRDNVPRFRNYYLRVNADEYFNPASTVKLPTLIASLNKLNEMKDDRINKYMVMLTDSSYPGQTRLHTDSTSDNGYPSLANYIKKILIVSDNDAYNRLYEFAGQEYLNKLLWKKGYTGTRITRRFVRMNEEENKHTNQIRFILKGREVYKQPAAYSSLQFDYSKKHLVGKGYMNRNDSLINEPMDFTTHNIFPLEEMQKMLQTVLFPESVSESKRFNLSEDDYKFIYKNMSTLPYESDHPKYDTSEFFDSYTKFFFFRANKQKIPQNIKVFNKAGWTYGFLTDIAYIIDPSNHVEFMLTATIYTNRDGILNDDKYDYETVGYPFFQETGKIIYNYELGRRRSVTPDFSKFLFQKK